MIGITTDLLPGFHRYNPQNARLTAMDGKSILNQSKQDIEAGFEKVFMEVNWVNLTIGYSTTNGVTTPILGRTTFRQNIEDTRSMIEDWSTKAKDFAKSLNVRQLSSSQIPDQIEAKKIEFLDLLSEMLILSDRSPQAAICYGQKIWEESRGIRHFDAWIPFIGHRFPLIKLLRAFYSSMKEMPEILRKWKEELLDVHAILTSPPPTLRRSTRTHNKPIKYQPGV